MNYEEMSDFQINKRVASKLGLAPLTYPHDADMMSVGVRHSDTWYEWFDYCNNPSDSWPIIVENNISMRPMYIRDADGRKLVELEAIHVERDFPRESFGWDDKNPLRAAMIVFLMMQEKAK